MSHSIHYFEKKCFKTNLCFLMCLKLSKNRSHEKNKFGKNLSFPAQVVAELPHFVIFVTLH